jgi:hypothetical protein
MKVFGIVMSVIAALAAVAGAVFVIVKYGDQISAWFKKTFGGLFGCGEEIEVVIESAENEVPVEEIPVEEAPTEDVVTEGDFEG